MIWRPLSIPLGDGIREEIPCRRMPISARLLATASGIFERDAVWAAFEQRNDGDLQSEQRWPWIETIQGHLALRSILASQERDRQDISGLAQAQTYSRCYSTFGAIRCATARAEHRNQHFIGIATRRAVGLDRTKVGRGRVPLVALVALVPLRSRRALGTLRSLRPGLSLRSRHPLNALGALRTRRPLNAGISFWSRRSRIAATGRERDRQRGQEYY